MRNLDELPETSVALGRSRMVNAADDALQIVERTGYSDPDYCGVRRGMLHAHMYCLGSYREQEIFQIKTSTTIQTTKTTKRAKRDKRLKYNFQQMMLLTCVRQWSKSSQS